MITIEEFNKLPDNTIIQSGIISNSPTGIFMTRDEKLPLLKYVVFKYSSGFWCVYIGKITQTDWEISRNGDKNICSESIKRIFPCDEETWKKYNH